MIHASMTRNNSDGSVCLTITGHAGSAPKGQNLLCAAATALAYTAAQAAQCLYNGGLLEAAPEILLEPGNARIRAVPTKAGRDAVHTAFWTVQSGLFVLMNNYPANLDLAPMGQEAA